MNDAKNDIADFVLDESTFIDTDKGLATQDLSKLDIRKLTADTLEVMSRQATVNVGTIGHVAHGKSTVVKALSGVKTQKYHREAVMNITIHLGYANAKVFQCESCPRPSCFQTYPSSQPDNTPCPQCSKPMRLKRHFSFVDCPGHDVLMATMLNGAAIMDAALLLIAANESFPQPQTLEHLAAVEMVGVRSVLVLQNKVDLVQSPEAATAQKEHIQHYLATRTAFVKAPIIPISAQLGLNLSYLLDFLVHIPLPRRVMRGVAARLHVLRSFDISHTGDALAENTLCGGVVGGSLQQGVLCIGDVIEFLPGLICVPRLDGKLPSRDSVLLGKTAAYLSAPSQGPQYCVPLRTTVCKLQAEKNTLEYAIPGGLIAVGTALDPSLMRQNRLRGQMLRVVNSRISDPSRVNLNDACDDDHREESIVCVYQEIDFQFHLLKELLGIVRPMESLQSPNSLSYRVYHPAHCASPRVRIDPILEGDSIVVSVGTQTTVATVLRTARAIGRALCRLENPVCGNPGDKIVLARYVNRKVRLIGWGTIKRGVSINFL